MIPSAVFVPAAALQTAFRSPVNFEKFREYAKDVYICFVDFEKCFVDCARCNLLVKTSSLHLAQSTKHFCLDE